MGVLEKERSPAMFGLGYQEILLILVIVLILFGAQRLPDLARSLGSSVKEFKKGVTELKDETSLTQKKDGDKKA
jgi:sec-independent protein translocase protein TatA